jgi:hypothetical protein
MIVYNLNYLIKIFVGFVSGIQADITPSPKWWWKSVGLHPKLSKNYKNKLRRNLRVSGTSQKSLKN